MSRVRPKKEKKKEEPRQAEATEYSCVMCKASFSTAWAKSEHELIHMRVRIQCPDCEKTYSNRSNLSRHRAAEHTKIVTSTKIGTLYSFDGKKFHCGECSSIYKESEEDAYWDHIQKHYKR